LKKDIGLKRECSQLRADSPITLSFFREQGRLARELEDRNLKQDTIPAKHMHLLTGIKLPIVNFI